MNEEKYVSIRECEIKINNIYKNLGNLEERVEKLESRFWWIITLLIGNLVGVLILLIQGSIN